MRIALCNEVLAGMPLERQCEYAARLGYDGLEIAPFTLSASPEKISAAEAAKIRATVEASGLVVTGLHWPGCRMLWRKRLWLRPVSASHIASSHCLSGKPRW